MNGIDTKYFEKELRQLIKSLPTRPPEELARYLRSLANTAIEQGIAWLDVNRRRLIKELEDK